MPTTLKKAFGFNTDTEWHDDYAYIVHQRCRAAWRRSMGKFPLIWTGTMYYPGFDFKGRVCSHCKKPFEAKS